MILRFSTPSDKLLKVTTITKLHDNEYFSSLFIDYSVVIFDYISMVKLPQYIDFRDNLLLLFLTHYAIVEFFPHKSLPIAYPLHFLNLAEAPYIYLNVN